MNAIDYTVYLVTDAPERYAGGLVESVEAALAGGVTVVQFRPTTGSRRALYDTALALHHLLQPRGVPLIVNDHVDLALAVDAEGVHVGQADLPVDVVRRLIGANRILGLSVTAAGQLNDPGVTHADYLGVGPVFATGTKPDAAPPLGVTGFARIRAATAKPLVAIGGLTPDNASDVFGAGADGVAVVSAFSRSTAPAEVAKALHRAAGSNVIHPG